MKSSTLLLCLTFVVVLAFPLDAQPMLFVRAGFGRGETAKATAHVDLRIPVTNRLQGIADVGVVVSPVVCDDGGPNSLSCSYSGRIATAGVAIGLLTAPRFALNGSGTVGVFQRKTGVDAMLLTSTVGLNASARVTSRLWLDLAARYIWIRDREYDSQLNAYPHLQMVTAGFGFSL